MASIHSGSPSDPCPHHIFNKASMIIAPHLCNTINSSFESATFAERWKHAEANTLLKKPEAEPDDPKNYLPISLLPFPAKVIEKIVNSQLSRFLEDNKALYTSQSGFRKNHSTRLHSLLPQMTSGPCSTKEKQQHLSSWTSPQPSTRYVITLSAHASTTLESATRHSTGSRHFSRAEPRESTFHRSCQKPPESSVASPKDHRSAPRSSTFT
ncbi:hypothetical protein NDU88_005142 [Pleurodeles waltl]|uniref:Reverse transcriptase domain-containing protein n=1 Tax=Pleurodeles waltl TaxID=8319 RepID=A0AAV7WCI1_PLEWA|nr:hypothetical protein NDU88_005142 [Pleurodeles waltl]